MRQVGEVGLPRLLSYGREALAYLCENSMVDDDHLIEPRLTPTKLARALFHRSVAVSHTTTHDTRPRFIRWPLVHPASSHGLLRMPARLSVASCFAPDEGLVVFRDLVQAQSCLLLETDLHLLYLLTPVSHNLKPDFAMLWKIYQRAAKHEPAKVSQTLDNCEAAAPSSLPDDAALSAACS